MLPCVCSGAWRALLNLAQGLRAAPGAEATLWHQAVCTALVSGNLLPLHPCLQHPSVHAISWDKLKLYLRCKSVKAHSYRAPEESSKSLSSWRARNETRTKNKEHRYTQIPGNCACLQGQVSFPWWIMSLTNFSHYFMKMELSFGYCRPGGMTEQKDSKDKS